MNSYILPRSVNELFGLAECMLEGMRAYEDALQLPSDLTIPLLSEALANARNSCRALKADTKQGPAYADACKRASAATKPFFPVAKDVLSPYLGSRWSQKWKQIGWITRRGRPPVSPRQRELLLAALWHYFKANPAHQNAARGVTMEAIVRYHNPLREARLALEAYEGNLAKVRRDRTRAMKRLRKMIRGIVDHLDTILDDTEESWDPFGLIPPALQLVPDWVWPLRLKPLPPEEGAGKLHVTWNEAPRALYYEVFRRSKGIDPDFIFVDSLVNTELVLSDLPVNTPITIRVVPINLAGAGMAVQDEIALQS